MKKKILAILLTAVLGLIPLAFLTACGEETAAPSQYSYYSFVYDETLEGLVLDVTYSGKLPSGELALPEVSFYYKDTADAKEDTLHENGMRIVAIADNAFKGCNNLTSVILSSGIKQIGSGAFADCTGLESVSLNTSVTAIPDDAFNGCTSLKSISGGKPTAIGDRAFRNCMKLTSFGCDLSALETVGNDAFFYCIGIKSIDVSNATEVSDTAFTGWREGQEIIRSSQS